MLSLRRRVTPKAAIGLTTTSTDDEREGMKLPIHSTLFLAFMILVPVCCIKRSRAESPRRHFELHADSAKFWKVLDGTAQLTRIGTGFGFTEGPVWDSAGFLYVSDEEQNKIYRLSMNGEKKEVISL